ncbi:ionotropic receptor 93a-like [Eriocheir sinensis]|uniref:ionotropic receptor 93a-like n=1 Tax=Eriocheir sinensis TaxID=95602 RepID=UPI0021CA9710|nr:ionotropic receptor 93a-like [Eriocheir sinensis]
MCVGDFFESMAGILLGQSLLHRLPSTSSSRVLVAAWLMFALILGTAYSGNLTASLTLPKYPPRPETLAQLVKAVDR